MNARTSLKAVVLTVSILASMPAFAGECVLSITREACAGKEEAAYKPYGGKKVSEEKKTVASEADCKAQAEKAAKIVRKGTLSSKSVTAMLDGKPAGEAKDTADCK